jgi:tripartite-type tricarboxylate transporter receptor subunit TctC
VNAALKDPDIAAKLMVQGIVPKPMTVAEYTRFVGSETEKFGKIVEQANIKLSN